MCSHMCAPMRVCSDMCVFLCVLCVLPYVCSHDTVSLSQFHPPHCLTSLAGIICVFFVLRVHRALVPVVCCLLFVFCLLAVVVVVVGLVG